MNASERGGSVATAKVYLDLTHVGRHVTGIERIAIELFEKAGLAGVAMRPVRARGGTLGMILVQQLLIPLLALVHPRALFVFPGFPPSPLMSLARRRTILYVHDCFLLTRRQDLGWKARLYMAGPFRLAVTRLKHFLVNSSKTRDELTHFVGADAEISLYRPGVRNVFGLEASDRAERDPTPRPLRLLALGTIEPRKNYAGAAGVLDALRRAGFADAELHVVGREGWGDDAARLKATPGVVLHGYLSAVDARRVIERADLYLCTSHDEGLGLPLLEVQYAGLPVIAPDAAVFREVLGGSGTFIDPASPGDAARRIAALVATPGWRATTSRAALANVAAWNASVATDRAGVEGMLARGSAMRQPAALGLSP